MWPEFVFAGLTVGDHREPVFKFASGKFCTVTRSDYLRPRSCRTRHRQCRKGAVIHQDMVRAGQRAVLGGLCHRCRDYNVEVTDDDVVDARDVQIASRAASRQPRPMMVLFAVVETRPMLIGPCADDAPGVLICVLKSVLVTVTVGPPAPPVVVPLIMQGNHREHRRTAGPTSRWDED